MLVRLTEVIESSTARVGTSVREKRYTLREILVNPDHVVCLREEPNMQKMLTEGFLPKDMDQRQLFTRVQLNRGQSGIDLVVVGNTSLIEQKLFEGLTTATKRTLLRD
jgi:hypothetical protein